MDKFGQEILTTTGENIVLTRSKTCKVIHKEVKIVKMQKFGCSYRIVPYINRNIFSNDESLLLTKKMIWKKVLKHKDNYNENYITKLLSGLKKLGLNIKTLLELSSFVIEVRNSMFEYIVFNSDFILVSAAHFITIKNNQGLEMSNIAGYVVAPSWKKRFEL